MRGRRRRGRGTRGCGAGGGDVSGGFWGERGDVREVGGGWGVRITLFLVAGEMILVEVVWLFELRG